MWESVGVCGRVWESTQIGRAQFFLGPTAQIHLHFKEVQELSYQQKNCEGDPGSLNVSPDVFTRHGDLTKHRAFARTKINPMQTLETCLKRHHGGKTSKSTLLVEKNPKLSRASEKLNIFCSPTHSHSTPTHSHMGRGTQNCFRKF